MAAQRSARILSSVPLNHETKILNLSLSGGEQLGFIGGQYVIVNTQVPLPGGKIAKRAYSILSSDEEQKQFQIAVRKVGTGPGSNYMHETQTGSELLFSGPWGQFVAEDFAAPQSALVVATDTGITAALGLTQGRRFRQHLKNSRLIWFKESSDYFIPEPTVRERVSGSVTEFSVSPVAPVRHHDRLKQAMVSLKIALDAKQPDQVFLSGDGDLLYPFKEEIISRGVEENRIKIECFFNNPFRKIADSAQQSVKTDS